ncbi:MAG TPA: OmpH family outer membrane protein [Candidatus Kapabacteria bacterium]|nr:OmpH family outer membrane protein [Candidatus Kapabacteria bacterium]
MANRNILGLVFLSLLSIAFCRTSVAQSKMAFIDAAKLLKQLPEATDADSRLAQLIANWNKEVSDMESELTRKRADYEKKKLIMSDAERTAFELDITDLKKRIDQYRQQKYGPNGELATQQATLMKPAYDKLLKAIEEVALEGKYDYVFDKASKDLALLYTNAKFDLTNAVAKKLGLETNDIFSTPLLNKLNTPGQQGNTPQQQPPVNQGKPIPPPPVQTAPH